MQKGFNSDINVRGKNYHVQTEDWGEQNPYLVSRVFLNGAVLQTIKVSYGEALKGMTGATAAQIQTAMRSQHHRVMDDLFAGKIG